MTLVYGEVVAAHVDPIEKKPLYPFPAGLPVPVHRHARAAISAAASARTGRSPRRRGGRAAASPASRSRPRPSSGRPSTRGCRSISYTYTEPTIFFEYAYDTAAAGPRGRPAQRLRDQRLHDGRGPGGDPPVPRRGQRRPQGLQGRDLQEGLRRAARARPRLHPADEDARHLGRGHDPRRSRA